MRLTKDDTNMDVHMHANGLEIRAGMDENEWTNGVLSLACVSWCLGWKKAVACKITKNKTVYDAKNMFT